MFGFLIKKTFFDMWDNLIRMIITNLGFILLLALIAFSANLLKNNPPFLVSILILGIAILFVYSGVASWMAAQIADYSRPEWSEIGAVLKTTYPSSLLFALLNMLLAFLFSVGFPIYGSFKSFIGPLASSFMFWILVFWVLAFQYFFPLQARLERRFFKILKKMFLLLLDNPLFTFGLFLGSLIILVLSIFTAFLLFGIGTILLWWNVALKLRMYKYDHLERNPDDRRRIPWDALLTEDRERVGKRTLKGMIFPWKE
jgi:hypothetical protein